MRPMPANKFQLTPQPGAAAAIFASALRYAASATIGMPSAPGAFTIIGGGGAEMVAAATWKLVFACWIAMTAGPDGSRPTGETAATGVMAACTAGACAWNVGGAPPTAPANTNGAITAMPNAGVRVTLRVRCRTAATAGFTPQRPPMRTRPSSGCELSGNYVSFLLLFLVGSVAS